MTFIDRINALAKEIEQTWATHDYEEIRFAGIATRLVRDARLVDGFGPRDVIEWVLDPTPIPKQHDIRQEFGQPSLTVYNGRRFHIDVLFWLEATTAIHQHFFSGCFYVLAGGSVHSDYKFHREQHVSSRMILGDLELRHIELLKPGDIREVKAGPQFIHALFHLEHPSMTLVVRTFPEPQANPQYTYLLPGLAVAEKANDELTERQIQTLEMIASSDESALSEQLCGVIPQWSFDMVFRAAYRLRSTLFRTVSTSDEFRAHVRNRWPHLYSIIEPTLQLMERKESIGNLRANVTDPDLRFFLAVLLNAPNRRWIDQLIEEYDPGCDHALRIERWLGELSAHPHTDFELGSGARQIGALLARGVSDTEVVNGLAARSLEPDSVSNNVRATIDQLRAIPMLQPLFDRPA